MAVRVQSEDFDLGQELSQLTSRRCDLGALVSLVGLCRDFNQDMAVTSLYLEHYPGMVEHQLAALESEARHRWSLKGCLIIHRYGLLKPGDQIVLVATASVHRVQAFDSCQFLIDWLKTKAPFWKAEQTPQGLRWLQGQDQDQHRAARWLGPKE